MGLLSAYLLRIWSWLFAGTGSEAKASNQHLLRAASVQASDPGLKADSGCHGKCCHRSRIWVPGPSGSTPPKTHQPL